MAERIHEASQTARDRIDEVLGPPISTRDPAQATDLRSALTFALRFYYDAFEAFDAILYPLEFGTPIAETNPVEIRRISPLECELPARRQARGACPARHVDQPLRRVLRARVAEARHALGPPQRAPSR